MSEQLPLHVAAKAVLVDPATNRALILRLNEEERNRKGRDEWHLPGGVRDDPSEALHETARREVREETGIGNTRALRLVDYGEWQAYYEGNPSRFLALIFELEVEGAIPEVVIGEESSEYAWVGQEDLDNYPALFPEARAWIEQVLGQRTVAHG